MQECHYELVKELIEIELLKKDFYNKESFSSTLSFCKKQILESYTYAITDLMIGYVHILHELEDVKDLDIVKKRLIYLTKLFERSINRNLKKNKVSKIYYLFSLFKEIFERDIINEANHEIFDHFRSEYRDTPRVAYERILTKFYNLVELAYLYMSGLQINCKNIKDDAVKHSYYNIFEVQNHSDLICKTTDACELQFIEDGNEYVHFYILPEFRDNDFIPRAIAALKEIHMNVENITLIVDYKLHPPFVYNDQNYAQYQVALKIFKHITLTNCNHVDFNDFVSLVNIEDPEYRDSIRDIMQRSRRDRKTPLTGEILKAINKVSHDNVDSALKRQPVEKKQVGQILRDDGLLTDNDIKETLRIQKECEKNLDPNKSHLISTDEVDRILSDTFSRSNDP